MQARTQELRREIKAAIARFEADTEVCRVVALGIVDDIPKIGLSTPPPPFEAGPNVSIEVRLANGRGPGWKTATVR